MFAVAQAKKIHKISIDNLKIREYYIIIFKSCDGNGAGKCLTESGRLVECRRKALSRSSPSLRSECFSLASHVSCVKG